MRLIDIVNAPWAITPDMLSEVQGIYSRHMRGDKLDIKAIEAATGKTMNGSTSGYDVTGGVAVLPLDGVLAKKMNLFMQISGGTSMQMAANSFREALADSDVSAIVLCVDSPGGTVDGTQEFADLVYNSRGVKPVVSLVDGTMASAAYWIGSAASQVFLSSETDIVGSIGVVQNHVDISQSEASQGRKTTEIAAGKYKRIASQYGALTLEGRAVLQDQVDQTYKVFVEAVARNRGVSADVVLQDMADGRVFIGQQAIDAGLVDGVSTLDALIARAAAGEFSLDDQPQAAAGALPQAEAIIINPPQCAGDAPRAEMKEKKMDVNQLKAEHPAVAEALVNEGKALGAVAERERIQSVEAQAMSGHEALIASLKFDGKTTGPEAAVQVLSAERSKKANRLDALRADADAAAVRHAAAPEPGDEEEDDDEDDDEEKASGNPKKSKAEAVNRDNYRLVAKKAEIHQAEMRAKGVKISTAEAVAHVSKGA